jgi:hypothetical protein
MQLTTNPPRAALSLQVIPLRQYPANEDDRQDP